MLKRPTNQELRDQFERLEATPDVDCRSFVMGQIKDGRTRMRSRYVVLTEYLGLRTTWIVLVLSVVGILNLSLYIISHSREWGFLDFGASGFWLVATHLPFGWWALAFAMLAVIVIAMKRFSFSYSWPFHVFAGLMVFGIFFASTLAFASGINDRLYKKLVEEPGAGNSWLARVYCFGANRAMRADNALIGEVMDVTPRALVVQTPELEVVTVVAKEGALLPSFAQVERFQVVKMLGKRERDVFTASRIKIDEQAPTLALSRDDKDCVDKKRWLDKQQVVQKRREAVQQPFTPMFGTAQLIKNIY